MNSNQIKDMFNYIDGSDMYEDFQMLIGDFAEMDESTLKHWENVFVRKVNQSVMREFAKIKDTFFNLGDNIKLIDSDCYLGLKKVNYPKVGVKGKYGMVFE